MRQRGLFTFHVCAGCESPLEWKWNFKNLPFCEVCFNYLTPTLTDNDEFFSLFSSHGVSHKILRHWKKNPHTLFEEEIFRRAEPALKRINKLHLHQPWHGIVSIPQSDQRAFFLGGGPARRIAKKISKKFTLPVFEVLEKRNDRGPRQAEKSHHERMESTIQYQIRSDHWVDWNEKRILLIDDFRTTGQTIKTAQAALRDCGVARVDVLVLGHRPHFFNRDIELAAQKRERLQHRGTRSKPIGDETEVRSFW